MYAPREVQSKIVLLKVEDATLKVSMARTKGGRIRFRCERGNLLPNEPSLTD
jgi:hypothetical protein